MSVVAETTRIGVIGAGNFTRRRLIPGFRALPGVEFVAVANSSLASSERAAAEAEIPIALGDWKDLVAREDVDAVLVGTPPYFHHDAAIGALEAGKHVMTVTRMSASLHEARQMWQKAEATGLTATVYNAVKASPLNRYVKHLLDRGYVGALRQVFASGFIADYPDAAAPVSRRRDPSLFGPANILSLGGSWDLMRYWFGDPARVLAWSKAFVPERPESPGGPLVRVGMPDAITVIAELPDGAAITCIQSGVARFGQDRIEIFGEDGTLVYRDRELRGAQRGDTELQLLPIPAEFEDAPSPEAEFIAAVRGSSEPSYTFRDGLKNMEFLEAAHLASQASRWVDVPLP